MQIMQNFDLSEISSNEVIEAIKLFGKDEQDKDLLIKNLENRISENNPDLSEITKENLTYLKTIYFENREKYSGIKILLSNDPEIKYEDRKKFIDDSLEFLDKNKSDKDAIDSYLESIKNQLVGELSNTYGNESGKTMKATYGNDVDKIADRLIKSGNIDSLEKFLDLDTANKMSNEFASSKLMNEKPDIAIIILDKTHHKFETDEVKNTYKKLLSFGKVDIAESFLDKTKDKLASEDIKNIYQELLKENPKASQAFLKQTSDQLSYEDIGAISKLELSEDQRIMFIGEIYSSLHKSNPGLANDFFDANRDHLKGSNIIKISKDLSESRDSKALSAFLAKASSIESDSKKPKVSAKPNPLLDISDMIWPAKDDKGGAIHIPRKVRDNKEKDVKR